jgi:hypothetical protein
MYQNPTLFPQVSNRESWNQIVQIADDDTGDLIALTDSNNISLYAITLEISAAGPHHGYGGYGPNPTPYYDFDGAPVITATLANYIAIVDTGTIQIAIPKSVMTSLHRTRTYDVFLTIDPLNADDGRQLLIGKLPVMFGGINT